MATTKFEKWLDTYLEESELPMKSWEIASSDGTPNFFSTEVVVEFIKAAPKHEQAGIKNMMVKIDFRNGDMNDYFKHLSQALAAFS